MVSLNAPSNKSMDVRAKQRLSYLACPLNFGGRGNGFAPRHLNRSTLLERILDANAF